MKTEAVVNEQSSVKLRELVDLTKQEIMLDSFEEEEQELGRCEEKLDELTKRSIRFQESLVGLLILLVVALIGYGVITNVFESIYNDTNNTYIIEGE